TKGATLAPRATSHLSVGSHTSASSAAARGVPSRGLTRHAAARPSARMPECTRGARTGGRLAQHVAAPAHLSGYREQSEGNTRLVVVTLVGRGEVCEQSTIYVQPPINVKSLTASTLFCHLEMEQCRSAIKSQSATLTRAACGGIPCMVGVLNFPNLAPR